MTTPLLVDTTGIAPLPPVTPDDWLHVLTRRMDLRRLGVLMLRSYADGNAPLPEMTKTTKQSWSHFQRKARTNWGEVICDSVVDRVVPNGITVGGKNDSPLAKQAQKIWRDNRMNGVFKEWLRYGLIFGQSYLTVWSGEGSTIPGTPNTVITADSPETMIVVTDPQQHWRCRAAMRVWRNQDEARDYAIVWTNGAWQQYTRPTYTRIELKIIPSKWLVNLAEGAWTKDGQPGSGNEVLGVSMPVPIPVVVYNNPGGHGDYETHLDLINRINSDILERLVIQSMQAFRQRVLTGGMLPERDPDGNRIEWEKTFDPAPGALWNLPLDMDIKETQVADLSGILDAAKEDIRQLSAATRTPLPMLMPDNTNTSAEGAENTKEGHLFRCKDRLQEAKFGIESCMDLAVRVDGGTFGEDEFCELSFEEVDRVTTAERYQAALAARNAGESWPSIEKNVLGYSPDQIEQDKQDRVEEALLLASLPPIPNLVQERLEGQAPGTQPMQQDDVQGAPTTPGPKPNGQQPQPKRPQRQPGGKSAPAATNGGLQPGGGRS